MDMNASYSNNLHPARGLKDDRALDDEKASNNLHPVRGLKILIELAKR